MKLSLNDVIQKKKNVFLLLAPGRLARHLLLSSLAVIITKVIYTLISCEIRSRQKFLMELLKPMIFIKDYLFFCPM